MAFFPESKAFIDPSKFTPISEQMLRLMNDCGMCRAISWSFLDLRTDILGSLPKDARDVAWAAVDPLERGYCVSIYQAQHPAWPGRIFTFVVASKDSKSHVYESPSGESVPMELLLKHLAEQQAFWSWRSGIAKVYMVMALLFAAVGIFVLVMDMNYAKPGDIWLSVFFAPVCFLVMPAFILTMPRRSHNKSVAKLKKEAADLELVPVSA